MCLVQGLPPSPQALLTVGNAAEFAVVLRSVCVNLMLGQKMNMITFRVQEKGCSLPFPVCFLHLFHFSSPVKENLIYLFYMFFNIFCLRTLLVNTCIQTGSYYFG